MKLTVIIICRFRREKGLERALKSVGFADEVMVEEVKATIKDFAKVRNDVLRRAKNEWVMFVDSDEKVTPALAGEIQKKGDSLKDINGFYLKRRDRFLGKWLRFGETASVRLLRLGRKDAGRWERPIHETWMIGERTEELKNPILHYSHQSVDGMAEKLDRYAEIEAEYRISRWLARWRKFARSSSATPPRLRSGSGWPQTAAVSLANLPTSLTFSARNLYISIVYFQLMFFPFAKFIQNYFLRLGVLDGMEGFIHALMMSGHSFLVRAKILTRYESTNSSE